MPEPGMIPIPANVVSSRDAGESADQPKLDELVGETVCIRALEWIGEDDPPKGVRLYLHIIKGEQMTAKPAPYRAYTVAVLRVAHQLAGTSKERGVKLEQWPKYKVVKSGTSYALADA